MAGMRAVEELLKLAPDMYDITVFGSEPHGNYNRILLSPVLAAEKTVADIIFDEVCFGVFTEESRAAYVAIIDKLKADGCDAVALVCTEIPLLITQEVSPLPILDSTRLLAAAAVEVAIAERAMPEWRCGPIGRP